jgi:cell division protein FtsI/penicillin-binding protein 2
MFIMLGLLLRAGDTATGLNTEVQVSAGDTGALGRYSLGRRLTGVASALSVLLAILVLNLGWIQVVQARELANHPANTRYLAEQARQDRGSILTRDGVVLAESVPAGRGTFQREYPENTLAAHTVGYYSTRYGRAGIEAAANDALTGRRTFRTWSDVIDSAMGRPIRGDDVLLTIDSRVQRAAERALGDQRGSVVAIDPRTGAVLASASTPGYHPADVDEQWERINAADHGAPLLDRGRQSLAAPGSTFKIVTLTGALSAGIASADTTFTAPARIEIGGAPITNFRGGSFGSVNLRRATTSSINTVYAQLSDELGPQRLVRQSERFGFNNDLGYELPVRNSLMPNPREMTRWETAWAGVGQPVGEHESPPGPQATVMQMALVAAGIANDGEVMRPYVIEGVVDDAGLSGTNTTPRRLATATDAATAAQVTALMVETVRAGSGTRAAISGVQVAGKTGTAEVGRGRPTDAWFIAFAPADNPTVALAVRLEGAGTGGNAAAPVARTVLEAALAAQQGR